MAVERFLGTRPQQAFILSVTVQAIIVLVMIAIVFRFVDEEVTLSSSSNYKTIPCYLAIFAFAEIFEFSISINALRLRNVIQLVGILAFHAATLVFAALQIHETRTALVQLSNCDGSVNYVNCGGPHTLWRKVKPLLIVVPCVIGVSEVAMILCVRALYAEFGWAIFHVVGANPKMKTMYQWYQIMVCLLKFDFFIFTGVTMQLLIVVLNRDSAEFGLTIAAIPVVLVLLILCGVAVQREIKWLMSISLFLMVAAMSYSIWVWVPLPLRCAVVFKLVRFYEPSTSFQYVSTRATLTTFTIVAFLLLLATFIVGCRCFSDFGRGLQRSKVASLPMTSKSPKGPLTPGSANGNMSERQSSYLGGGALENRISIE